jgi:hypothetical protein
MSSPALIDLAAFLERHRQADLSLTAVFQDRFSVTVGYLSQRELLQARRRSLVSDGSGPTEAQDRFMGEMARLVRSWRGLTLETLASLTNVALPADLDPAEEVPCTPANVAALFNELPAFYEFVLAQAGDLAAMRRAQAEEELKN